MTPEQLAKLSPAPWIYDRRVKCHAVYSNDKRVNCFDELERLPVICYQGFAILDGQREADWEFIALARNAEDAMVRRGMTARPMRNSRSGEVVGWMADFKTVGDEFFKFSNLPHGNCFHHPFVAIVEADRWLTEQENQQRKGKS